MIDQQYVDLWAQRDLTANERADSDIIYKVSLFLFHIVEEFITYLKRNRDKK